MKKILVPYDFSNPSLQAFLFALQLAKKSKGKIVLLHVIELPVLNDPIVAPLMNFDTRFFKDLKAAAEKKFDVLIAKWGHGKINIQYVVQLGRVKSTIQEFVRKHTLDLVIMGTHGADGLPGAIIGSTTNKVVGSVKIPVLSIRKSVAISTIKNIVVPTTLKVNQKQLVDRIKKLQQFFNATIHLVLINTPANLKRTADEQLLMENYAKQWHFKKYTLNTRNDFTEQAGILNFAYEIKADIIAMGTHGRTGLAHLFNADVAEGIVDHNRGIVWTYLLNQ